MSRAIEAIRDRLNELATGDGSEVHYEIPSLWMAPERGQAGRVRVNPAEFYRDRIQQILDAPNEKPPKKTSHGDWSAKAVVYNLFVRHTAAFDHNANGVLDLPVNADGWRETGTFLKALALLPYIKFLGCNTIHLLPVTAVGQDGNKGTLGSPYAIRNPYKLDETLAEPILGRDVGTEFGAFIQAAHRLGFRIVMEFVFRTASKDSDWVAEHPSWFYWIYDDIPDRAADDPRASGYGSPYFSDDELRLIHARVRRNDFSSLPPPNLAYRQMFADPPKKAELVDGRFRGSVNGGRKLRIPPAFADWPPMDVQPPWDDVTYLKLYDNPQFNYIAYNTIRMYDSRLAKVENENRSLWNSILNIIPHYQKNFHIDGVMIDMGHALPHSLKHNILDRARRNDPDFAFWEENFSISGKSRHEGYNATVGYLPFDEHQPQKLKAFLMERATLGTPVPFFATPENHNTPRAATRTGGIVFAKLSWVINNFIPGIPFIHQGFELGERFPVNTGLDFSPEEIARIPSSGLPLFSEAALDWCNADEFTSFVSKVSELRRQWRNVIIHASGQSFHILPASSESILAFLRVSQDESIRVVVVANLNCLAPVDAKLVIPSQTETFTDLLGEREFQLRDHILEHSFAPGECMVGLLA